MKVDKKHKLTKITTSFTTFQKNLTYVCLSVRTSFCNMYELLLTYCYSTKKLRNYAFDSLFKDIFVAG